MSHYIKLRKKGFNYYTDYTEKYLNETFAEYSYYLTLRKEAAEYSVKVFWDNGKYLTLCSDFFAVCGVDDFANMLAKHFKTEYEVVDSHDDKYDETATCYMTSDPELASVNEDFLIRDGMPDLRVVTHDRIIESGKEAIVSFQNHGGIGKGVTVTIECSDMHTEVSEIYITSFDEQLRPVTTTPTDFRVYHDNDKTVFQYEFSSFMIPEGINLYSTKYTGKKKQNICMEKRALIHFVLSNSVKNQLSPVLTVWADAIPDKKSTIVFGK